MARQVLPIAGAIIGGIIGGPVGAQIGMTIGSIAGNAIDPQIIQGPKIGEAGLQTSAEGVFRPIVFGTAPVKGNVIERGNRQIRVRRTSQGKGSGPVTEEERVFWTFAIRIAEGPIAAITRIWMDEKLVYDVRPTSGIPQDSAEFASKFRLYLGDQTQLPDPDIEAYRGIGNTPAYRGTAYIVFPNFDLTDRRESIPDFRFEVASQTQTLSVDALMSVNINPTQHTIVSSPDGFDWDDPPFAPGIVPNSAVYLTALPDRYLATNIGAASEQPVYTDDLGQTWSTSTGPAFVARGRGSYMDGLVLIPAGTDGVARSVDNGTSFSISNISGWAPAYLAQTETFVLVLNYTSTENVHYSQDRGLTWTAGPVKGMSVGAGAGIASNGVTVRYGGRTSVGSSPIIREAISGTSISTMALPAMASATVVTAMAYGVVGDEELWFAGTDSGEVLRDNGGGWELMPWLTDGACVDIAFVGNGFVFASAGTSGPFDGALLWTANGDTTSTRPIFQPYQIFSVASLPTLDTQLGQPFELGDFVAAMHLRAGHTSSDYDVSELTDLVDGLVLAGDYNCGDAIRTVMPVYFFDGSEYDSGTGYRIHYPKRGKPVVKTVTVDDLISAQEKSTREDALERPRVLHMHYENPNVGYVPAKATSRRDSPDVLVVGERSTQVPVVFGDEDEAAQISHKLLKVVYAEIGGEEEFTIHDGHLDLVPADCVGVSLRGQVRRMRVTQQWIGPGEIQTKLMPDRQSAYTSNVTGIPVPEPTPPLSSQVGIPVFAYLDIPALTDTNDRLLYYVAATGQREAYAGTVVQLKDPTDTDFADEVTIRQPTIMGVLIDDVPAASEHYTDLTNTVRVQLYRDEGLDSLTDAQFLSEGGAFALENEDGTWEVMQYRDASDEGGRIFALTHLARGRLNTGGSSHLAGAAFVLLDGVYSVDAVTAWIDQTLTHRPVNIGRSPDGSPQYADTYTGQSQIEFPVAHLFADLDGASLELSCVPRHRFGTELNPVRSVNWIGYRWTATDGVNAASADTVDDNIAFDVSGWGSPITATVAQINRFTGPGPTVSEQVA